MNGERAGILGGRKFEVSSILSFKSCIFRHKFNKSDFIEFRPPKKKPLEGHKKIIKILTDSI